VDRLALTTGMDPVPGYKKEMGFRHVKDKFAEAGLSAGPSDLVRPSRVMDVPIQLEAKVTAIHSVGAIEDYSACIEVQILRVHVEEELLDPEFRHPYLSRPLATVDYELSSTSTVLEIESSLAARGGVLMTRVVCPQRVSSKTNAGVRWRSGPNVMTDDSSSPCAQLVSIVGPRARRDERAVRMSSFRRPTKRARRRIPRVSSMHARRCCQWSDEWVTKLCRRLEEPGKVHALELADLVGLSPSHVQRTFSREMGVSPHQYGKARRIEGLRSELRSGTDVTSAVYEVGFNSTVSPTPRRSPDWA